MKNLVLVTLLFLSACTVSPDYAAPDAPAPVSETELDVSQNPRLRSIEPVAAWWQEFDDPLLAEFVERALAANNDVRVAIARVFEARAFLGETRLDRLPTVESRADYARQRLSEVGLIGPIADRTISNYEAGFDAFWELDLFGQVQRRIEGARARSDAALAELDAVYVTVAAETARAYMDLRGAQYALNVAQRNEKNQAETLRITTRLRDGGRASELDVSRAKTQLELTRSQIPPLEARIQTASNRLGVLTTLGSQQITDKTGTAKPLPSIPQWINVGSVADLVRRRPDVRQVERELAAATADYGVAVTNLYPTISLTGTAGFQSVSQSDFGSDASSLFSVGPSIRWPAFNLGRVRAQIRQADARSQAALARFEQQVLLALEDIQTSMTNFSREEQRRLTLYNAAQSASNAARIARLRFDQGLDDFLDVLDAERVLLETESQLAESETTVATNLVAIYKALGGGWQVAPAIETP